MKTSVANALRRWRRRLSPRRSAPDWNACAGYGEVCRALDDAWPLPADQVLQGPLRRLFELSVEEGSGWGTQARAVEHIRHWRNRVLREAGEGSPDAAAFKAEADALARSFYAEGTPHAALMEVYDGRMSHHGHAWVPTWRTISDPAELSEAVEDAWPLLRPDEILDGALRRALELSLDDALEAGERARLAELARQWTRRFLETLGDGSPEAAAFQARADALVRSFHAEGTPFAELYERRP